ncbi:MULTISPECIES: hypothetical protein [Streptomyces]|uniref:Uncharacterized protein n=1 Tax=Streptomyces canarius TaxID=285453 RepID=A0ABQ3DCK1_9ACTN|nr:hypothetical protein [Streptomyces canarius]GHA77792.1 hypothetical protein GCM10010345_94150 [Streptomyces canarius]
MFTPRGERPDAGDNLLATLAVTGDVLVLRVPAAELAQRPVLTLGFDAKQAHRGLCR